MAWMIWGCSYFSNKFRTPNVYPKKRHSLPHYTLLAEEAIHGSQQPSHSVETHRGDAGTFSAGMIQNPKLLGTILKPKC